MVWQASQSIVENLLKNPALLEVLMALIVVLAAHLFPALLTGKILVVESSLILV